ncbi:MAG: cation:proton antiporter [Candidatus Omnitrophota bacterium]
MNIILSVGVIFLMGLVAAKFAGKIRVPSVTGYLLLGILIGPAALDVVSEGLLSVSGGISNVVLGLIAFGMGQNFSIASFRRIGKSVIWISVMAACVPWILITCGLWLLLGQPFYLALLFGAIGAATAPAATIMVVREHKSRGTFTDTLLGVVAVDDAWCLIVFAVSLAIAQALHAHTPHHLFLTQVALESVFAICGAFVLGGIMAFLLSFASRYVHTSMELLICMLGFLLLTTGLAIYLNISALLANMFLGAVLANTNKTNLGYFDIIKNIDSPLYLIFFVVAGANLEVASLARIGMLGGGYIVLRFLGKIIGAYIGGVISKAGRRVTKFLGLGLMPQAGVALGCALIAKASFPRAGELLFTTILATTIIYEIIGPMLTRYSLKAAGEI